VKVQITNDSDYDGIVNVETIFRGGTASSGDPRAKRKISLAAHETKKLVTVWEDAPRHININTLISANLPNEMNIEFHNIARLRSVPIDKEGDFIISNVKNNVQGEVIVDNEDKDLFELSKPDIVGLLPKWLEQFDKGSFAYSGIQSHRPPLQWTLTTNDKYYGTHIRSAYVIKSGNGNQTATWKVPVPSKGLYDLYYYVYMPDEIRNAKTKNINKEKSAKSEYHLTVKYDNGEDIAYVNLKDSDEEGWRRVGLYYFSDDTVKVVLSNKIAQLRMVTADAVKIVKRESDKQLTINN
jgi:predicted transposase YbfD/YdcC